MLQIEGGKLLINLKKCFFVKEETMYLVCVISTDGLNMDLEKIKVILEWPTPESVGEVRSIHELASFYRKFIRNFNSVCSAMIETIRGDKKKFKWTHGADKSFETLKQNVAKLHVLDLLDFTKVFQVDCDASGNAIGIVLNQQGRPIAFYNEKLNDAKKRYSFFYQEFYAIVQDLKK